jgi:small subunit ribosomal protein S2
MKELLEAGVHFGHQTHRWNPKMKPFIYTERNGIHIIDLQKTVEYGQIAYDAIKDIAATGGKVLFVGTKKQAQDSVRQEAEKCQQYFVTHRWLGGMLTNWTTIRNSIQRLKKLEKMEVDGTFEALTKKEILQLNKEKEKLERNLGGIKEMDGVPDAIFIIDPKKESIAVNEARKLNIPIFAIVDTNCDPEFVDFPIPGNDDAIRAIGLFCQIMAEAVLEGLNIAGKEMMEEGFEEGAEESAEKPETGEKTEEEPEETSEKEEPSEEKTEETKASEENEEATKE